MLPFRRRCSFRSTSAFIEAADSRFWTNNFEHVAKACMQIKNRPQLFDAITNHNPFVEEVKRKLIRNLNETKIK